MVIVEDDEVCVGSNPWVRVYTRVEVAVDVQLPDGVVRVQLGAGRAVPQRIRRCCCYNPAAGEAKILQAPREPGYHRDTQNLNLEHAHGWHPCGGST